jgi:hypothetical protein
MLLTIPKGRRQAGNGWSTLLRMGIEGRGRSDEQGNQADGAGEETRPEQDE